MGISKGPEKDLDILTGPEMEVVTVVFHQFETGLREGTIYTKDILDAMKALGLNPGEQEVIDMTNEVANNGLVYFPDFCKLALRKYREDNQELFHQQLFKVLCGTDPYPQNFRAKRYRIQDKSFTKEEFCRVMRQLPVQVEEEDIEGMFNYADRDKDGKISYSEFLLMINPPKIQGVTKTSHKPDNLRSQPAKLTDQPAKLTDQAAEEIYKQIQGVDEAQNTGNKMVDKSSETKAAPSIKEEKK